MLGVSQESSARPNEHGLPGLGLAAAMDAHGLLQFRHRVKDTAPDTLIRQVAEEPLHLVQPRGTGGGEMNVNPRMLGQPGFDFRRFVGRVVIHDQVQRFVIGSPPIDQLEKANPVLMIVGGHAHVNDRSILRM
jgi:hypothetical protein